MTDDELGKLVTGLAFPKLGNGYTVKYHVKKMENPLAETGAKPNYFGGEIYCTDLEQVKACVLMLIDKHKE